ncbi:MAG TPA: dTMP kinase [Thiobacillaceae bacterium]|nr:dTMP kinase [Thiobacillaceae bacterium]
MAGKFISLEGVDGAGKSTHLEQVARFLRGKGRQVVLTREPGGTELGERLRDLLLHRGAMHPDTEALLMFAARLEHVEQVIKPALARGDWVISDRFTDASYAYQCGGRGIPEQRLKELEDWVLQGFRPALTLLFDVPPEVAALRRGQAREADRFEQEAHDFFQRVRDAYLVRARREPERIKVINADQPISTVRRDLAQILEGL